MGHSEKKYAPKYENVIPLEKEMDERYWRYCFLKKILGLLSPLNYVDV